MREKSDTRYLIALAEGATSWQIVEALRKADFLTGEIEEVSRRHPEIPISAKSGARGDDRGGFWPR